MRYDLEKLGDLITGTANTQGRVPGKDGGKPAFFAIAKNASTNKAPEFAKFFKKSRD